MGNIFSSTGNFIEGSLGATVKFTVGQTSNMGHRYHMLSTSRVFEIEDDQNSFHQHPEPPVTSANSFMLPAVNASVSRVNYTSPWNLVPTSTDFHSPSLDPDIPNYGEQASIIFNDPYRQMSTAGSFCPIPMNHAHHASFSHYYGDEQTTVAPSMDGGRGIYKRKRSPISPLCETCLTRRNYSAGSSSSLSISSNPLEQAESSSGSQHWHCDPVGMASNYRVTSLQIAGEGYQRNIRRRSTLHIESNPAGSRLPSNLPHNLCSAGHHSMVHSGTGDLAVQSTRATTWERSHVPVYPANRARFLASDNNVVSRELNHFQPGSSISNECAEMGRCHDHIHGRNPGGHTLVPPIEAATGGQHSYGHRQQPAYRNMSSHQGSGYVATLNMDSSLLSGLESFASSRHLRPLSTSTGRCNNARDGRARISFHRLQSLSEEDDTRDRLSSEDFIMMIDRSAFYGSRNLYDQHRDMRLDIDSMSYEELIALGERIGNVNTGLSEDTIAKCLKESCPPEGETVCIICLEEYEQKEEVGQLDCGHSYHCGCIEKWLSIKNVCPVCKAPAATDTPPKGNE